MTIITFCVPRILHDFFNELFYLHVEKIPFLTITEPF